jgi:PTH1 family peptidyl-tRNA hydrolase
VRVGVGRPGEGEGVAEYVLSPFASEQPAAVAVQRAADAVECVLREGEEKAMNSFNVRTKGGSAAAPAPMGRK